MTKIWTLASSALLLSIALTACGDAGDEKSAAGKGPGAGGPGGGAPRATAVEAELIRTAPLARELIAVGSVRSDESVTLRPEIPGRVARITFKEGQTVQAGQLLFELDDSVWRAERAQAGASLALARRNHQRAVELAEQRLVSQQERDTTAANLDLAQAAHALAEARLQKSRITAPFTGVTGLRMVSPGDYVSAGQELVNLEAMNPVKVEFRIAEAALSILRVGQSLDIEVDAYPGETFRGEVYVIDPRVADATRSIALRARVPNDDGRLRPGLFARVRLQVDNKRDALLIPEQAIFPRGEQQFVYVIEEGKAALREVTIGQRLPGKAEIVAGLAAGETVITAGLQKIGPGAPVAQVGPAVAAPAPPPPAPSPRG